MSRMCSSPVVECVANRSCVSVTRKVIHCQLARSVESKLAGRMSLSAIGIVPDEWAESWDADSGWLSTSDAGYCDENGYLYFVSRHDEIVNCGGLKISPQRVDDLLKPIIAGRFEYATCGIPDPSGILGEVVCLCMEIAMATKFRHGLIWRMNCW